MVLEETSGLYYDYSTGYYYDAQRRLYYDGTSGNYLKYNYSNGEYEVQPRDEDERNGERKSRKRRRDRSRTPSINEDGEIMESASDQSEDEEDASTQPPPCMRLVIQSTDSGALRVGSLFIVTCMGGTVGRTGEGDHDVALDDVGCSKYHAKITYSKGKFFVVDLGSRNGTFVNRKRISPSKVESEPVEIGHGTELQVGTTSLACHVHPGKETCLGCEPGVVLEAAPQQPTYSAEPAISKEAARKKEMREMKKKYGFRGDGGPDGEWVSRGEGTKYQDRAGERRKQKGSDNPYEKTEVADVNKSIKRSNKGFKMLAKMGWSEGGGLGKGEQGRVEPVLAEVRAERAGLGVDSATTSVQRSVGREQQKRENWEKARERFKAIPSDD